MPTALIGFITPYVAGFLATVGASATFTAVATGFIASALVYGGLAAASYLASAAFAPDKPSAPKPEDGKFNLKQSVPPLVYVLGKVKKGGDYALLEEKGGTAYHITVWAAHSIKGFTEHWLHDEKVTLNGSDNVTSPAHFNSKVKIQTRLGAAVSTAYANVVAALPTIWTSAHRGDGLATVMMAVKSVSQDKLQKTFPSGMPQLVSVGEGNDQLVDPRTGVAGYSTNFALFRYWHLAHPVGGKMSRDDLYAPDWAHAADVCDQAVTNKAGGTELRYHGGMWFRANNDPVQIGRLMDQAAELVIYERPDGLVGVHAGEFVEPDVRLTANDIIQVDWDPNKRRSTNVIAVRGRYTDPTKSFSTMDAAIYGLPYPTDDERTKTVDNSAVQKHNHIARLQKLAYIRANAPRVKLLAHYEPARRVPYRRFVRVHLPPKMTEAIVEITGRPTLSLGKLTYEFEGIVVPANLYAFNAATEEGVPGGSVEIVERDDVPIPIGFDATIESELVGSSANAAFALATWIHVSDDFTYEFEWEPTAGGPTTSVFSVAGETSVRTPYLSDGVEYRFRLRTLSAGAPSDWTGYVVRTAVAEEFEASLDYSLRDNSQYKFITLW